MTQGEIEDVINHSLWNKKNLVIRFFENLNSALNRLSSSEYRTSSHSGIYNSIFEFCKSNDSHWLEWPCIDILANVVEYNSCYVDEQLQDKSALYRQNVLEIRTEMTGKCEESKKKTATD